MDKMLSCDWGTSSFRLRLVNISDLSILALRRTGQGIAATHALWELSGARTDESGGTKDSARIDEPRLSFYQTILGDAIAGIEQELGLSLEGMPLIISGMASSSIGMLEMPYTEVPFLTDGSSLRVEILSSDAHFKHDTLLISGAKTENDVMRGEETQLVGCGTGSGDGLSGDSGAGSVGGSDDEQVFIFPGTHSKHVWVRGNRAMDIKTYMTGEFFDLLSKKSILAGDVETGEAMGVHGEPVLLTGDHLARFEGGVRDGAGQNLLHSAFGVRTNRLLRGIPKEDNYYYLSGLLIGTELKELGRMREGAQKRSLTLVSNGALKNYYLNALRALGFDRVRVLDAADAVLMGQRKIAGDLAFID
jgi:2-dehydro-3-deoxygalactonokinase